MFVVRELIIILEFCDFWLFILFVLINLYFQVSFSQIPYKTVIERSQWQEKVCHHFLSPLICC